MAIKTLPSIGDKTAREIRAVLEARYASGPRKKARSSWKRGSQAPLAFRVKGEKC